MRTRRRYLAGTGVLLALLPSMARAADQSNEPAHACDRAAAVAEERWHIPAGLLSSIGTVESGRTDMVGARPIAWPWTINAAGASLFHPTSAYAIAMVRSLQAAGFRLIDVGCFQINLAYHPEAFTDQDRAFDPDTNAAAAARILTLSHDRTGSWDRAIALYHSATPERGAAYLTKVRWAWSNASGASAAGSQTDAPLSTSRSRSLFLLGSASVVQWTSMPQDSLPIVLQPIVAQPGPSRLRR